MVTFFLSHLKRVDLVLVGTIAFICLFGLLMMVYSASYPLGEVKYEKGAYFLLNNGNGS
ncbi:hypothetical protein ACEQPO_23065 [Bacillus sp. SL00103]